jgi:hypothetical protein
MKNLTLISTIVALTLATTTAFAAKPISTNTFEPVADVSSPFTFTAPAGTLTISYDASATGTSVSEIFTAGQGALANQSPKTVGAAIQDTFGLSPLGTFNLTATGDISGSAASIMSPTPFNYLAVHLGQYEVFFSFADFGTAGSEFKITDVTKTAGSKGGGLSNFRAYSFTSPVPEPSTYILFGAGFALISFIGMRRKAKI